MDNDSLEKGLKNTKPECAATCCFQKKRNETKVEL